jgi:hypothetical protein
MATFPPSKMELEAYEPDDRGPEGSKCERISLQQLLQRSDGLDDYVVYLCVEARPVGGGKWSEPSKWCLPSKW